MLALAGLADRFPASPHIVSPRKGRPVTRPCSWLASLVFLVSFLLAASPPLTTAAPAPDAGVPGDRGRSRVYTDEDLARVSPLRGQTGVESVPAGSDGRAAAASTRRRGIADDPAERAGGHGEAYWRRESQRVQERVRALRRQADDLRRRIDARRREPGVLPLADPRVRELTRQLDALEGRMRELGADLEDRARRAGAPPGWLR